MTLFSPSFPIGSFAWSHGLESAIREGRVEDAATTRDWIAFLLAHGSGWTDAVLFAEAWRASSSNDTSRLREANALALALPGAAERRLESEHLGEAFCRASLPWSGDMAAMRDDRAIAYAIAAGWLAAKLDLPLQASLAAFLNGFVSNLVQAASRLVPLGQSEAVQILYDLSEKIVASAGEASGASLDDLGSAALVSDIAAMRHETLQPRLFRS
ncbi:MAG: urease accessory protein UreF [Fulvimarina manganoxydans]|uniref:urease accessory protein UreF n=1 Tax=Fulvimarina manganoxydans TaxID=937218 RepID=UPI002353E385|nr:urease accessory protein UreF [Fulvimarina manganoxydans]MCK5931202.1 urease accessory protein UreF [Fulvimarina manganoxydans]